MALSTTIKLSFNGTAVARGLASIKKEFGRLAKIGSSAFTSILSPVSKLAAILGPTALVGGVVAFAKASSDSASNLENLKAQLEIFTGSAGKAEEVLAKLRKLAVQSPLELSDISDGARLLLSYGVSADEVVDSTSRLSEVSAGNAEKFQRLALAFGQASAIGRLMGTELRQFTESGFNPLEAIAAKTGETMLQLRKRMEDGKVTIVELKESLRTATSEGGRFYGLNAKMSKTFSGQMSMMKDQWSQFTASFGEGMNNGLKVAFGAVTNFIPRMTAAFTAAGSYLGQAIADAVYGDYGKFVKIGEIIGEAIKVGIKSVYQSAGESAAKGIVGNVGKMPTILGLGAQALSNAMGKPISTGEAFAQNLAKSNLGSQAAAIKESAGSVDYSNPANRPKMMSGEQLQQMLTELRGINQKLTPQP